MSQEEPKTPRTVSDGISGDELDQVRDLLFGSTIREFERQREALQKDVNVGFAEADQMTNRRLDDVMRRLDALQQELQRDREERKSAAAAEAQRIDKSLVKLASEQASALAHESQRIDKAIELETQRVTDALAAEKKRVDEALDALHRQLETDKMQHIDALRQSVSTERSRLSQNLKSLAEGLGLESGD